MIATLYVIEDDGSRREVGKLWFDGTEVRAEGSVAARFLASDQWTRNGDHLDPEQGERYVRMVPSAWNGTYTHAEIDEPQEPVRHERQTRRKTGSIPILLQELLGKKRA